MRKVYKKMKYHKINSIFKRRMDTKEKLFILGEYADPAVEYLKNNEWEFTEKIDGTNIRIMFDSANVRFGGRTDNAQIPVPLYEKLQELFTVDNLQDVFSDDSGAISADLNVTLFGEGCGHKIQKGGGGYVNNEKRVDFILFDVHVNGWWLKREDVNSIAETLGIRSAPVVGRGTIQDAINLVADGFTSTYGDFISEGLVIRPAVDLLSRSGKRIITKIKHRDFKHLKEAENVEQNN